MPAIWKRGETMAIFNYQSLNLPHGHLLCSNFKSWNNQMTSPYLCFIIKPRRRKWANVRYLCFTLKVAENKLPPLFWFQAAISCFSMHHQSDFNEFGKSSWYFQARQSPSYNLVEFGWPRNRWYVFWLVKCINQIN